MLTCVFIDFIFPYDLLFFFILARVCYVHIKKIVICRHKNNKRAVALGVKCYVLIALETFYGIE